MRLDALPSSVADTGFDEDRGVSQVSGETGFKVVRNEFGHVSIWPAGRAQAPGWHDHGFSGTRERCLEHIAELGDVRNER
ncbi:MbtH family NRPS accessory protein [Streptomyces eurythermus]|uniref:MbtH family NRPS accessory protein n=1 Tax=Streptomyces eurythermus TaxID=42237 RepID=A0ABW6Z9S5_9ACTN